MMPNVSNVEANETTPLVRRNDGGIDGIRREFEDALQEEEPGTTLYTLICKRPVTVIVALCLFGLLFLAASSLRINTDNLLQIAREVSHVTPVNFQLIEIGDAHIKFESSAALDLDFSQLGATFTNAIAVSLANKLGYIEAKLDGPATVQFKQGEQWRYLILAESNNTLKVQLNSNSTQLIHTDVVVSNVGRSDAIGDFVNTILQNKPVELMVSGNFVVSKYGINYKAQFDFSQMCVLPKSATDDFAQLLRVEVEELHNSDSSKSILVNALANATIPSTPGFSAKVPLFDWQLKIPGCDATKHELVCFGTSREFGVNNTEFNEVEVNFDSKVDRIPPNIVEPCFYHNDDGSSGKSPLDRWISDYLVGRNATFYIEGRPSLRSPQILNEILCGYEIPYFIYEADEYQKLIQNVNIEEVMFDVSNPFHFIDFFDVRRQVTFSGRALVDVVLPRFLDLTKGKTSVMVNAVRGNIQLFKQSGGGSNDATRRIHFAQIIAEEWIDTLTISKKEGYKVNAYFDKLPMDITDSETFTRVSNEVMWNGHSEIIYDAVMDVDVETSVGSFTTQRIHISGKTDMRAR